MADVDQPLTLPAAIEGAARRFPGRPAYIEPGARRSVTWGELHRLVQDAAAGLVALGLQRGDRLAICAENSIDWIVAFLATVTAGGVGVLVYYDLKAAEIGEHVSRPGCRFLVASESVLAKAANLRKVETVIVVGQAPGKAALSLSKGRGGRRAPLPFASLAAQATPESRATLAARAPPPDDLAVVLYTSGTTGGAKGVMLSHRNFLANGHAAIETLCLSDRDSVLLVLPLHHAMPFFAAVVLPGLVGAHFVIENDLRRIRDRLQEYRPTLFFGVPALYELMYRNLLARAEAEGRLATLQAWQKRLRWVKRLTGVNLAPLAFRQVHQALGGRLRFLVCGGAALNPQTARDFLSLGLPLIQGWGMTEAATAVAVQRFSRSRFLFTSYYEDHAGSVGPPLPGIEVRLIDVPEKEIRVATNGEGEIIVRGQNVFLGYWDAEEETRAAMLDGWLRTGDLGRIDKDGNIYITGRSKYIIVLESGEKVYPDELEDKLRESPLIEDVCVRGRRVRDKTQVTAVIYPNVEATQLAATRQGLEPAAEDVRRLIGAEVERLGKELAAYKRVVSIDLSDAPLPKTPLQKVARGRLEERYEFVVEKWLASGEVLE